MEITAAVAFPLLCSDPSFTHYTRFRQPWSDLTCGIAAGFPPVNSFNCIADLFVCRFCSFHYFYFWQLKHIESSRVWLLNLSALVQLTPFELWVKAITQNLWVEAIPSASAASSFLCFPSVRLLLITLTAMDGIHRVLRLDSVMRFCDGFRRKWFMSLHVHPPL